MNIYIHDENVLENVVCLDRPYLFSLGMLADWDWYRIYTSMNWAIIGPSKGLPPIRCQILICTNSDLFSIGT